MKDTVFNLRELNKLATDFQKTANTKLQNAPELLKTTAGIMYESQRLIFEKEGAHGGHAGWKEPQKRVGKKQGFLRKRGSMDTLVGEGNLRKSVGLIRTGKNKLDFGLLGSVIPYAYYHQYGIGIVQREFLFVTDIEINRMRIKARQYFYKTARNGIQ